MDILELIFALLAVAFTLWAAVVGWIGKMLGQKLDRIVDRLDAEAEKLNGYIIQTETRLAVLEQVTNLKQERKNGR